MKMACFGFVVQTDFVKSFMQLAPYVLTLHDFYIFCFYLAPTAPTIIPEECSAENNSVTVAWQPPPQSHVEGYVLELDDGNGGEFRVSE